MFRILTRDSGGGLGLMTWQRRGRLWRWVLSWQPYRSDERRRWLGYTAQLGYQAHRSLHILRLGRLVLSTQDYPWMRGDT